jgi:hypothetical protein
MRSPCCLCVCVSPLSTFEWLNQSLWNLVCISWHLSQSQRDTFINPSHQSVCLYMYPPIVARLRLGKNFTTATNTQAKIEELLVASFSMPSVSYQTKEGDCSSQNFLLYILTFHTSAVWLEGRVRSLSIRYISKLPSTIGLCKLLFNIWIQNQFFKDYGRIYK